MPLPAWAWATGPSHRRATARRPLRRDHAECRRLLIDWGYGRTTASTREGTLAVGGREYEIFRLAALAERFDVARLPFSLKVLLENLLRTEGSGAVSAADIEALAGWDPAAQPSQEIAFTPARVLMQDLTGVPAVVDLAAMRDAMALRAATPPASTRSRQPSS